MQGASSDKFSSLIKEVQVLQITYLVSLRSDVCGVNTHSFTGELGLGVSVVILPFVHGFSAVKHGADSLTRTEGYPRTGLLTTNPDGGL